VILAASNPHLALIAAALALGALIGIYGHIIHSRALILSGIVIIGAVSAYFSFVLQPGG
jgi:hypothetical protein